MEEEPIVKSFLRSFLKSVRLQCLDSNLKLEQLGKMNSIASDKYNSYIQDTSQIQEKLKCIEEEYVIPEEIFTQLSSIGRALDTLELTTSQLEDTTSRLELRLKSLK